jgi:hypothetical protein
MRFAPGLLAVAMMVASAAPVFADCGDDPGDAADVAATRADIEATCSCASAMNHAEYVRCAFGVIRAHVGANMLGSECVKPIRRCATRSTCGRPGAVTCCKVGAPRPRCAVKRDASRCTGARCVGQHASCCDACAASGCLPPPTTTTTTIPPCGGGPFSCSGNCPSGTTCAPTSDFEPYCGCVPDGSQACESVDQPFCNGTCPPDEKCGPLAIYEGAPCACLPGGQTACGEATYPTCGGACPEGSDCAPFRAASFTLCMCADPNVTCDCNVQGACPAGQTCQILEGPCGCFTP